MSAEVLSFFWGCAMLSSTVLIHARSKTSYVLSNSLVWLGCFLLVISFGYSLNGFGFDYPSGSGLQNLDARVKAQERGDIILRGFMMLSGASTILASLNMEKNTRGPTLAIGLLLLVGALLNGIVILNAGWVVIITTVLSITVGTTVGMFVTLITQRLQRRS